jgi:hypothetical protein
MLKPSPGTRAAYWPAGRHGSPAPMNDPNLIFCWNCHDVVKHSQGLWDMNLGLSYYGGRAHYWEACTDCHVVQVHGTNYSIRFLNFRLDYSMHCHMSPACGPIDEAQYEFWANNWASDVFWEIFGPGDF